MNFTEIAKARQSCRKYNKSLAVEDEKIEKILKAAQHSPSACNGQPYHFTVCRGNAASKIADHVTGMGMNRFAKDAPVMIVISAEAYVSTAALGAKVKKNDYRSMDIGIAAAYITAEAACLGLGTCILGWFDDKAIREICGIQNTVRLVITLGYPADDDKLREKKRKNFDELVTFIDE